MLTSRTGRGLSCSRVAVTPALFVAVFFENSHVPHRLLTYPQAISENVPRYHSGRAELEDAATFPGYLLLEEGSRLIENLVWFGIGTAGGLVFAVFFYLIAVALNARDKKKDR